eukprot:COSAG01_NODE_3132_length_6532_cov_6.151873_8_plen_172_part_00
MRADWKGGVVGGGGGGGGGRGPSSTPSCRALRRAAHSSPPAARRGGSGAGCAAVQPSSATRQSSCACREAVRQRACSPTRFATSRALATKNCGSRCTAWLCQTSHEPTATIADSEGRLAGCACSSLLSLLLRLEGCRLRRNHIIRHQRKTQTRSKCTKSIAEQLEYLLLDV